MKRLLFCVFGLTLTFVAALSTITSVPIASKSPIQDFMDATFCSPQPCWRGIQIGKTSVEQERHLLTQDNQLAFRPAYSPDWDFCWETRGIGDGCVGRNWLGLHLTSGSLRLADAILLFGYPTTATNCYKYGDLPSNSVFIDFPGHILVKVYSLTQSNIQRLDPTLIVDRIDYSPELPNPNNALTSTPFKLLGSPGPQIFCGEDSLE